MSVWPPPPDLESIQELVRAADPERHIAEGASADEYEPEEEAIYAFIAKWPTDQITVPNLVPIIEQVWRNSFVHDDEALVTRRPALLNLAEQIARFFGPEAKPQVRNQSL
jgi:hypothetical protein